MIRQIFAIAALYALTTGPALAGPIDEQSVPPELRSWIPWVLDEVPDYGCATIVGESVCYWPSTLVLDLNAQGGRFTQEITVDRNRSVPLPGSLKHWPMEVKVDGRPAVVLESDGHPVVALTGGTHRLEGRLEWRELPEGMDIPADQGLVSLRIDGTPVSFVRRDPADRLWLRNAGARTEEEDRLTLEVFRRIDDGIPMMVTTVILVRSSGKSREVTLPGVGLGQTVPMQVQSELPVRLEKDGSLTMQTRGGTFQVEIVSIVDGDLTSFVSNSRPAPWPSAEIWVFAPDEALRQVDLSGAPGIDPARTNLPDHWKTLSAFTLQPEESLNLKTVRRGEPEPPPDRLTLSREIWLDMDGDGFTVRDALQGTLTRTDRLDMAKGGILGHVTVNGEDQVITKNSRTGSAGVELRSRDFTMTADARLIGDGMRINAIGWHSDVQKLDAKLHLPPGWELITARGVDSIPGTWWDNWSLYGFFFVLLVSISIGRLIRWYWGALALVTLVLLHNHAEMAAVVIIALPLLVGLGLLQALPKGRFRTGVGIGFFVFVVGLVAAAVPFSVNQIRTGLYPQLAERWGAGPGSFSYSLTSAAGAPDMMPVDKSEAMDGGGAPAAPMVAQELEMQKEMEEHVARKRASASRDSAQSYAIRAKVRTTGNEQWAQQQDPQAVVQTGPGIPSFQWTTYSLNWFGPVAQDQEIRLYFTGPGVNLLLSIIRVVLLALLSIVIVLEAVRVLRHPRPPATDRQDDKSATTGAATTAAAVFFLIALAPPGATAQLPDRSQLDDLKERLTRLPDCEPSCVSVERVSIELSKDAMSIDALVHAGARMSWRVPGPAVNWAPSQLTADGRNAAVALRPDGFLHVRLEPGTHRVTARGPLPADSSFTLEFGDPPRTAQVIAPDFEVAGVRDDGLVESSISFTRIAKVDSASVSAGTETSYAPWLRVERTLDLGIPWLVHTTITRVSPADAPLMVQVPLIPGESVTQSDILVKDGRVTVSLGRDETVFAFDSLLQEKEKLIVSAAEKTTWSEVWHLSCSPIWQCTTTGLVPATNAVDRRTFHPWPGERLVITTRRPGPVEGQSITVDSATLHAAPGLRLTEASLEMNIRSSRGGIQRITLPDDALVQNLTVNGEARSFKQKKNVLEVSLSPGTQTIRAEWQDRKSVV